MSSDDYWLPRPSCRACEQDQHQMCDPFRHDAPALLCECTGCFGLPPLPILLGGLMNDPTRPQAPLEPSDSPEAALAGDLGTVTDDEFWQALADLPPVRDDTGQQVDVTADVVDERPDR